MAKLTPLILLLQFYLFILLFFLSFSLLNYKCSHKRSSRINYYRMTKTPIVNYKLLVCLLLMFIGTYAGRLGAFMEPNCNKYRPDGTCQCCSFRFWMTPDGCCKPVSDQCKDWCPFTGKCTCCYLGYVLENGCCVLPCDKPVLKCQQPSKKWCDSVKKWNDWPQKCIQPVKKCEVISKKCQDSVQKCWVPQKPCVKICIEKQSCQEQKSCKSGKSCKQSKSGKSCKQWKSGKSCKQWKSVKQCKSNKKSLKKIQKLEKKLWKELKKGGVYENRSVMNKGWMGEGQGKTWSKGAGIRGGLRY